MKEHDYSRLSNEELQNLIKSAQEELGRRTEEKAQSTLMPKRRKKEAMQSYRGLAIGQEVEDGMVVISFNPDDDTFLGRDKKEREWVCKIEDYLPKGHAIPSPTVSVSSNDEIEKHDQAESNNPQISKDEKNCLEEETSNSSTSLLLLQESQIPLTKMHGSIRSPGEIKGLPSKRIFERKTNVQLQVDPGAPLVTRYEAGLGGLIKDLRSKGTGVKQIVLEDGTQLPLDGPGQGYQFAYDGEADLFEGARIIAIIEGAETTGYIVAVMEKEILISVKDDFGPKISKCLLRVDNTAMIETLRERLEQISKEEIDNFNSQLAEAVIFNRGQESPGEDITDLKEDLNTKQSEAVSKILSNEVFYLWGPPGTGKTKTLSALIRCLFDRGKRVLLCSNTNQAVDQVLLKLCEALGDQHSALVDGKILRIGRISHQELADEWSQFLIVDNIVERQSQLLIVRKGECERELDRINISSSDLARIQNDFKKLDKILKDVTRYKSDLSTTLKKLNAQRDNHQKLTSKVKDFEKELAALTTANLLKRVFLRTAETIAADINKTKEKLIKVEPDIQDLNLKAKQIGSKLEALIPSFEELHERLTKIDRKVIEKQVSSLEKEKHPLIKEIAEINKQLEDLTKSIVKNAKIVGATVTKSYLSKEMFRDFDIVIVDEASMVMLPALFYVAGLAKEKVVISGDSFQLSPIIQTDQKEIYDAVGGDVFESANVLNASSPRVVMLEEQYRMDASICRLISSRMYRGDLKTAAWRQDQGNQLLPDPFDESLIIIDTSAIYPYVNRDPFKSRYNMMNALAVRNLCLYLDRKGFISSNKDIGVCTPYAAQAKVLQRILEGANIGDRVEAGTVHRYQGDEKTVMVLDIPDSYGEKGVSVFLEADSAYENGAKLFNVAISRAKSQLIIVANLAYLDSKLPKYSFIRGVLADIVQLGKVVDVRSILALWPIEPELKRIGSPLKLTSTALETGLFNQQEFSTVCSVDIANARRGIVIFSGFITPQRVAAYETNFRSKIAEGVRIRVVTRPPDCNGSISPQDGKQALDSLEQWGCIVDTRGSIHEKAVIIDDEIVWFGSLNPLSHTSKTNEIMARIVCRTSALQISSFLALDKNIKVENAEDVLTRRENPHCPECNSRTSFRIGKFGAYWKCEECNWKENYYQARRKTSKDTYAQAHAPSCPECGGEMTAKRGRFGMFYSCKDYPKCKGKVKG